MTVSAVYAPLTYNGSGSAGPFNVTWTFIEHAELRVTHISASGVETVKSNGSHYTVSGGRDADGIPQTGTITMQAGHEPASGTTLRIERITPQTQARSFPINGTFPAKDVEAALDRHTLMIQEMAATSIPNNVMSLDRAGAVDFWDAKDKTIRNVADAVEEDEAVSKRQAYAWLVEQNAPAFRTQSAAPGAGISRPMDGWLDSDDGKVSLYTGAAYLQIATTSDLSDLAASVTTIASLRSAVAGVAPAAIVQHYATAGDQGGGLFRWDSASSATDDGFLVIRPSSAPATGRWLRQVGPDLNVKMAGARGDDATDDTAAIAAVMTYLEAQGGGRVRLPAGTYRVTAAILVPSEAILYGDGPDLSIIKANGSATEIIKTKPSSTYTGTRWIGISDIRLIGNASVTTGLMLEAVAQSRISDVRITGITATGAYGVKMLTWLDGATWRTSARNLLDNIMIENAPNGILLDKGAGDPNTHGCNFIQITRGRITGMAGTVGQQAYGLRIAFGEGNTMSGMSISSANDYCTMYQIEDSINTLIGCHADGTFGGAFSGTDAWGFPSGVLDNNCIGYYFTAAADGSMLVNLLGNGCKKRIDFASQEVFEQITVSGRYDYQWLAQMQAAELTLRRAAASSFPLNVRNDASGTVNVLRARGLASTNGVYLQIDGSGGANFGTFDAQDFKLFRNSTEALRLSGASAHILPGVDNAQHLGSAAKRFLNVYAATLRVGAAGDQVVGARRTGWTAATGAATRTTFATSTVTLPELAERMKALIDDLTTHGLIGS